MAYIGKQPVVGNFQVCDAITVVNGQAAYTMQVSSANVEPENANHMLVSLNGILQKQGSSFTISGATITFASNLATGDVIDFIILLGNVLDIGTPSDDSVGAAQIKDDLISGTTALAVAPADTDEFLVSDAGTLKRIDYSLIKGGADTIWDLKKNGDQSSISDNTATKITTWTATIDTGSAWDNTNNKIVIPSGKDGKYLVSATITQTQASGNNSNNDTYDLMIYKNGSVAFTNSDKSKADIDFSTNHISIILDLDATDYLEIYVKVTAGAGTTTVLEHSGYQTSNVISNWSGVRLA